MTAAEHEFCFVCEGQGNLGQGFDDRTLWIVDQYEDMGCFKGRALTDFNAWR
jgi:hypothetical protein